VPLEYNIAELEPGIRQVWKDCLEMLQDAGCNIVPISLPNTKHALSAYYVLAPAEAASNLSKYDGVRYGFRADSTDGWGDVLFSKTRGEGFGAEVKRRILLGSYTLSAEAVDNYFLKAQKVRRLVQRDFDRVFAAPNPLHPAEQFDLNEMDASIQLSDKYGPTQVDYIVCPTAPTLPPTLEDVSKQTPVDSYMNDVFTVPASLAGIPAISIPFPISEELRKDGKPAFAGMQIIGQYSSDYGLISMSEDLIEKRDLWWAGKSSESLNGEEREHRAIPSRKIPEKGPTFRKIFLQSLSPQARLEQKLQMLEKSKSLEMKAEELKGKELREEEQVPSRKVLVRRFRKIIDYNQAPIKKYIANDRYLIKKYIAKDRYLIKKYVSDSINSSLKPVEGDLFLSSSGKEDCLVGSERPASNEEITNYVEIPIEGKLRRVYLVQPRERLPLTEKEISIVFEDAWAKWEEHMSSRPPG